MTVQGSTTTETGVEVAQTVLIHRNELNEQQRPGSLITFPLTFVERKGNKMVTRWMPKLIRNMEVKTTQAVRNVTSSGLLFYSGQYIRENHLDRLCKIHPALLAKNILFVTNHVDSSSASTQVSSMKGIPVALDLGQASSPTSARTRIEDWSTSSEPSLGIIGLIYNKSGFTDGDDFHTGPLKQQLGDRVINKSGNVYWLGRPAPPTSSAPPRQASRQRARLTKPKQRSVAKAMQVSAVPMPTPLPPSSVSPPPSPPSLSLHMW